MAIGKRRRQLMGEINVVPYIDVMLVLLIIFMITAPLLTQGVQVELPDADAQPLDLRSTRPKWRDAREPFFHATPKRRCSSRPTSVFPMAAWCAAWCCCSRRARKRSGS